MQGRGEEWKKEFFPFLSQLLHKVSLLIVNGFTKRGNPNDEQLNFVSKIKSKTLKTESGKENGRLSFRADKLHLCYFLQDTRTYV